MNEKMKVLVGSNNPVKIDAVKEAFGLHFANVDVLARPVESKVPDQPVNNETYIGARNRALKLLDINSSENLGAAFCVGIEGGIMQIFNKWFGFGCMCIMDENKNEGFGTSAHFEIPAEVLQRLIAREELGDVMDDIMKRKNTKRGLGAIGFFTGGVMNRKELYVPGLIAALVPFNNKEMYFGNGG
jgi:inosine/xanthosine triphosphatase